MKLAFQLRIWWKGAGFMSNRNAQVCILCEDTTHFHFARKYLELLGFNSRNIIPRHNPKGRSTGSGAVFVKENYEKELSAFRSKNRLSYILVVMIDDDTKNHLANLRKTYSPNTAEKILLFSPSRNIESWFHYIDGNIIDETEDYKRLYQQSEPSKFAKDLKRKICINNLPDNAPSSLHHACNELKRLNN